MPRPGCRLPADDREQRHVAAAAALAAGRWCEAGERLEDLSLRHPHDTLALMAGHQIDFFRGDSRMLRDRIARVLPAWDPSRPHWHAVLGMHAFGLEETADYNGAERQGRRAVELEPRDRWGWHAVAHMHEMRNRPHDGIAWLAPTLGVWSAGSFLGTHNVWHLALFHLAFDDHDAVLQLYDEAIGGAGSSLVLEMIDASAMLWRLQLRGVDIGARWQPLADRWEPLARAGNYAFNDFHAMLAFVGAGRTQAQQAVLDTQQATLAGDTTDNAQFTRDVGRPAACALQAFGQGDFATAACLLRRLRHHAQRFGAGARARRRAGGAEAAECAGAAIGSVGHRRLAGVGLLGGAARLGGAASAVVSRAVLPARPTGCRPRVGPAPAGTPCHATQSRGLLAVRRRRPAAGAAPRRHRPAAAALRATIGGRGARPPAPR